VAKTELEKQIVSEVNSGVFALTSYRTIMNSSERLGGPTTSDTREHTQTALKKVFESPCYQTFKKLATTGIWEKDNQCSSSTKRTEICCPG